MRIRFVVGSSLFGLILSFSPEPATAAVGWTSAGVVMEINQQPTSTGGQVFVAIGVATNPSGCPSSTGFYFAVNDERQKRMFAMLLAAQTSSRLVKIYTTGTCHVWGHADVEGVIIN